MRLNWSIRWLMLSVLVIAQTGLARGQSPPVSSPLFGGPPLDATTPAVAASAVGTSRPAFDPFASAEQSSSPYSSAVTANYDTVVTASGQSAMPSAGVQSAYYQQPVTDMPQPAYYGQQIQYAAPVSIEPAAPASSAAITPAIESPHLQALRTLQNQQPTQPFAIQPPPLDVGVVTAPDGMTAQPGAPSGFGAINASAWQAIPTGKASRRQLMSGSAHPPAPNEANRQASHEGDIDAAQNLTGGVQQAVGGPPMPPTATQTDRRQYLTRDWISDRSRNMPVSYSARSQPTSVAQLGPGEFMLPPPNGTIEEIPGGTIEGPMPDGSLPPGAVIEGGMIEPGMEMDSAMGGCESCGGCGDCDQCGPLGPKRFPLWGWNNACLVEDGVGTERLPFAIQEIEIAQPSNNFRLRADLAYDWTYPDRAEFFWAKQGVRGPAIPETAVDYQEMRVRMEVGGPKFSATTDLPIICLDPEQNPNTTGFGDMSLATKLVMLDGDTWQMTQFFKTTFATGSAGKGLGNGHISIEPGFLFRQKYNKITDLHYELRYWVPLGGDLDASGQVLRAGAGVSRLLYESDDYAIIPTLEFVSWWALDGQQTAPDGFIEAVDPVAILNVYPGVRFVYDMGCDLGLLEAGIGTGLALTSDHWYASLLRFELKWTY
ncbi:MAG: hypothetical protein SGJ20_14410 [Planctomycetota bacterium]|nr:hypothetical protein [Planctomycetota bacterium]